MENENKEKAEKEINLLDPLIFLLERKRVIAGITVSCMVITLIISLFTPNVYKAETRILPPQQHRPGLLFQMLGQTGGSMSDYSSLLGSNNQTALYIDMLQSRTLLDAIITRFDLTERYDMKILADVRKYLKERIHLQSEPKSNIIVLTVEDKDPRKASDMANAFVEELSRMTTGLANSEAAQRRLFFEEQLRTTKESLIKAEEGVKGFQEKTGALHVEDQVKSVIGSIAQLRAEVAAKEVEIQVMKTYSTPDNPDLQKVEETLRGMKTGLMKLESKSGNRYDPLMPTGRMPSVGTEYVRKLRDLKFNEALYELLLKQYEAAKLDEARDAAIIQVIDRAVPPERKAAPKRATMVFVAAFVGFFASLVVAFLIGYKEKFVLEPENRQRLELIKMHAGLNDLNFNFLRKGKEVFSIKKKRPAREL